MRKQGHSTPVTDCQAYAKDAWWHHLFLGVHRELMYLLPYRVMVLFHDHFDEATTFSGSQNTESSMAFNLRQLGCDALKLPRTN
jgi:hypothetical protein